MKQKELSFDSGDVQKVKVAQLLFKWHLFEDTFAEDYLTIPRDLAIGSFQISQTQRFFKSNSEPNSSWYLCNLGLVSILDSTRGNSINNAFSKNAIRENVYRKNVIKVNVMPLETMAQGEI